MWQIVVRYTKRGLKNLQKNLVYTPCRAFESERIEKNKPSSRMTVDLMIP